MRVSSRSAEANAAGRVVDRLVAQRLYSPAQRRRADRRRVGLLQALHDLGRRARRHEHAVPGRDDDGREACFGGGRDVRDTRHALRTCDREEPERAGLRVLRQHRDLVEEHVDSSRDDVDERRARALVFDREHVDARRRSEHRGSEVGRRPRTECRVGELAGLRPREIGELAQRGCRHRRMDREAERDVRDTADRDEIALRVVPDVGPSDGSDDEVGEAAKEQRVAVGRGARDGLGADRAACPGTVFDDDANAPVLGERVGDDARHVVGGAPGLLPGDDPDGAVGKRPGVGRAGNRGNDCRECTGEENGQEAGGSVCHRQWRIDRVRPVIRTGPHFRMAAPRDRRERRAADI